MILLQTQVDIKTVGIFLGAVSATWIVICLVQRWVAAHLADRKSHPQSDKIVYTDTCNSEKRRLEEKIVAAKELHTSEIKSLNEKIDKGFVDLKTCIEKNGGKAQ